MKKIIIGLFVAFIFLTYSSVFAKEKIQINFFYSTTCPHCAAEKTFLDSLQKKYSQIQINKFEFSQNVNQLKDYYQKYSVPSNFQGAIPITFIEKQYFLGFNEKIGQQIENCINKLIKSENPSQVSCQEKISLPILGEIDANQCALPVLSAILGFLDGFNVCSLGALVLILALVIALKSRARTLIFGGGYILTTAIIYGILIIFWYQLFNLLTPYMRIMQIVLGLVTIGGAIYFLKEFIKFRKQGPACEMGTAQKIQSNFASQFKTNLTQSAKLLPLLFSILAFTAIITVVEFPCSAAIPVAFAGILAKAKLLSLNYLVYISIYDVFYLLDELVIFLIAFFTMKVWLTSPKITVWLTFIESIILFILGFYYLIGIV